MHRTLTTIIAVGMTVLSFHQSARAGLTTFVGEDIQPTANPTVRTNSDAAAASFHSAALALGPVGSIDFESAPLGSFNNLTVAPGVTMVGTSLYLNPQSIRNSSGSPDHASLDGSNTTAGGSQFVEVFGSTLTFTFAQPTQFFGLYLTGVQTYFFPDLITFNDGTTQVIQLAGEGTSNGVGETAFIGFVDPGASIKSITVVAGDPSIGGDAIGVDDVSYQAAPQTVPEPSSLALCGIAGVVGLVVARARRQRH